MVGLAVGATDAALAAVGAAVGAVDVGATETGLDDVGAAVGTAEVGLAVDGTAVGAALPCQVKGGRKQVNDWSDGAN